MKLRTLFVSVSVAATASLLLTRPALAEELPPKEKARVFITTDEMLTQSKVLGDAWLKVVTAALDTMKRLSTVPQPTPELFTRPKRGAIPWQTILRARLSPGHRDLRAPAIELEPMPIEIAPRSTANPSLGQRGVLLGISMTLP